MRFLIVFLPFFFLNILSAQILRVATLQDLTASPLQNLDDKLSNHFDLIRHYDEESDGIRVYSNTNKASAKTTVVTAFTIKTSGCQIFLIVSHDENQVKILSQELLKNNFMMTSKESAEHLGIQKFEKGNNHIFIKSPDKKIRAHQIVFMGKDKFTRKIV